MHCIKDESVLEHTGFVVMYSLYLCTKHGIDPRESVIKATVHDMEESEVGDISTPTKYANPNITHEIQILEESSAMRISHEIFSGKMHMYWVDAKDLDTESGCIVAIADLAAVAYKMRQEVDLGNSTFKRLIPRVYNSAKGLKETVKNKFIGDVADILDIIEEIR